MLEKLAKELDKIDMPPGLYNAFLVSANILIIAEQAKKLTESVSIEHAYYSLSDTIMPIID